MSVWLPDARFEMPELLTPGAHPLGPVKVDWAHPLAAGLTVCIVFQQNRPVDLVSGRVLSSSGDIVWDNGLPLFDEVNDYFTLSNVTITSKNTILTHPNFTNNAGSLFQFFFSFGVPLTANTLNIYLGESSHGTVPDQLNVATGTSTSEYIYWPSLNNKPLAHVFESSGSPRSRLWVDGVEISQLSDSAAWSTSPQTKTLYIGAREDLNADRFFGGAMKYLYVYGATTLTPSAVASLARDPYQFLVPA